MDHVRARARLLYDYNQTLVQLLGGLSMDERPIHANIRQTSVHPPTLRHTLAQWRGAFTTLVTWLQHLLHRAPFNARMSRGNEDKWDQPYLEK